MTQASPESLAQRLPYGGAPLPGIITAGQLTAAHIEELAQAGVRAVVDLRAPAEPRGLDEADVVRQAGLAYHAIPVVAGALGAAEFDAVRTLLKDPQARPVVIHCATANRVGAVLIPYLILDEGRTTEDALQVAIDVGLRSEPLSRAAFAYVNEHSAGNPGR